MLGELRLPVVPRRLPLEGPPQVRLPFALATRLLYRVLGSFRYTCTFPLLSPKQSDAPDPSPKQVRTRLRFARALSMCLGSFFFFTAFTHRLRKPVRLRYGILRRMLSVKKKGRQAPSRGFLPLRRGVTSQSLVGSPTCPLCNPQMRTCRIFACVKSLW
jgi:hypothetical protein